MLPGGPAQTGSYCRVQIVGQPSLARIRLIDKRTVEKILLKFYNNRIELYKKSLKYFSTKNVAVVADNFVELNEKKIKLKRPICLS